MAWNLKDWVGCGEQNITKSYRIMWKDLRDKNYIFTLHSSVGNGGGGA